MILLILLILLIALSVILFKKGDEDIGFTVAVISVVLGTVCLFMMIEGVTDYASLKGDRQQVFAYQSQLETIVKLSPSGTQSVTDSKSVLIDGRANYITDYVIAKGNYNRAVVKTQYAVNSRLIFLFREGMYISDKVNEFELIQ